MDPAEVFRLEREDRNEFLPPRDAAEAIRRAVAAEREACAAMADAAAERNWLGDGSRAAPEEIAADIRARR